MPDEGIKLRVGFGGDSHYNHNTFSPEKPSACVCMGGIASRPSLRAPNVSCSLVKYLKRNELFKYPLISFIYFINGECGSGHHYRSSNNNTTKKKRGESQRKSHHDVLVTGSESDSELLSAFGQVFINLPLIQALLTLESAQQPQHYAIREKNVKNSLRIKFYNISSWNNNCYSTEMINTQQKQKKKPSFEHCLMSDGKRLWNDVRHVFGDKAFA